MKYKKRCFSTQLSDLYGRDGYQSHIEEGREYWWYFYEDSEISKGWHKIKITYVRSGCVFYVFTDLPDVPERFFPASSFFGATLIFADINPSKDLENFGSELDKKMFYFDTKHTIVNDWPNEKEVEIDENDDENALLIFDILCEKIKD